MQMKEQALKFKQELRAQDLNCKLLREKLTCKGAELEQRNDDVVALEQRRDWLEAEVLKLQRFLGEANQKISSLERQVCGSTISYLWVPVVKSTITSVLPVRNFFSEFAIWLYLRAWMHILTLHFSWLVLQSEDQKEKIKNLQTDVEGHVKELCKLKDQLPRIKKERDDLSLEAEQMGREALRLSTEVEALRRKVHELDEDVMVRDGQISILCNSLDDREWVNDRLLDRFSPKPGVGLHLANSIYSLHIWHHEWSCSLDSNTPSKWRKCCCCCWSQSLEEIFSRSISFPKDESSSRWPLTSIAACSSLLSMSVIYRVPSLMEAKLEVKWKINGEVHSLLVLLQSCVWWNGAKCIKVGIKCAAFITIFVNSRLSLCLKLIYGPQQHGLMFGSSYLNHLDMSS